MKKKGLLRFLLPTCVLLILAAAAPAAHAEGTRDLTANGGDRPYTERYNATVLSRKRLSVMHVYLKKGETAYFGTSVSDARLYDTVNGINKNYLFSNTAMGTNDTDAQLAYTNTGDIFVAQGDYAGIADAIAAGKTPGKEGTALIDLPSSAGRTTPGYICDRAQEIGGADAAGGGSGYKVSRANTVSSWDAGYVAGVKTNSNVYTAPADGVYTVIFFSSSHAGDTPVTKAVSDATPFAQTQKGGTIASWDISVYSDGVLQSGRVFTDALFLNMGGTAALKSDMYAVTDDGYQYKVDFNGMDPGDLLFCANKRGLLKTDGSASSSLLHSVRSNNDALSDLSAHGVALNAVPSSDTLDGNYRLFFEKPAADTLAALGILNPASLSADAADFKFTGTDGTAGQGGVGHGGTFSFTAADTAAASYQIELNFGTGNTVVLSDTLVKGAVNSIAWDGKDAAGKVVSAGTNFSAKLTLKSGEIHFPLLDVESLGGIRITRLNGTSPDSTVFYNHSAENSGDTAGTWTKAQNWTAADGKNCTLTGADSSAGALTGDGDKCALDVWTYGAAVAAGTCSCSMSAARFTATAAWNNTAGTPTNGNPTDVTMTLMDDDGNPVTTDAAGDALANPVTWSTSGGTSYTWSNLDPAKTYYAAESPVTGYTAVKSAVTGSAADGYAQTVTNTYVPANLKLTCRWSMNGSDGTAPASATLSVYADANKQNKVGDYSLSESDGWTKTLSVDPTRTYYVFETAVDGYSTMENFQNAYTIIGECEAGENGDGGFTSVITNSCKAGNYMSVEAFVLWKDDGFEAYRPASVTVTIQKDGKAVTADAQDNSIQSSVTLSAANGWYCIWPALAAQNAGSDGYTLTETDAEGKPLGGYAVTNENLKFSPSFGFGGFENTYVATGFTATASFTGTARPSAAVMRLQRSTDGGTSYTDWGMPVTLNEAGNWTHRWTDLPSYTSGGVRILYRAAETAPAGYLISAGDVSGDAAGGYAQTVANAPNLTQLTVTNTWDHGAQAAADQPASVAFQILAGGVIAGDSVVLTAKDAQKDGSWQQTVPDLPVRNSDGSPIVYTVVQNDLSNYAPTGGTVTGDAAAGFAAAFANKYNGLVPDSGSAGTAAADSKTVTNPDGSTTATVTDKATGTVTETTRTKDGTTSVVETQKDGSMTSSETRADGTKITSATTAGGKTTAAVTASGKTDVTVPAALGKTDGKVSARITYPDGTKKTVTASYSDGKVSLRVDGSATVEILNDFVPLAALPFTDVPARAWYRDGVACVYQQGLFAGTSDTTFDPKAPMTRQQMWMVLARMAGKHPANMADARKWAVAGNISDGSNPAGTVTREQFVTLLWRAAGSPESTKDMSGYTDFPDVADYAKDAMRWAVEIGAVTGTSAAALGPKSPAARAQIAVILMRYSRSLTR